MHQPGRPLAFVGLLLIKKVPVSRRTYPSRRHTDGPQLSVYDPKEELPVSKFPLSILPEANPSINCFQALDYLLVPTVNPFASSLMI